MHAMNEMHRYAYGRALVGDRFEYVSTAPQGPYAIYYEAELRRIAEGQPPQPVAGRHFVERHAYDALQLRKLIFAELENPWLKPGIQQSCRALPDLDCYGGAQMTDEHFMRRYRDAGGHRSVIKDMCEKHSGELVYVWDHLYLFDFIPKYDAEHMSRLPFWHPQLLTDDGHRQDLAEYWDELVRASRRGKGGRPSRQDYFNTAVQTPSSIWAVGLDRRLDRHRCACGIVETRFFSLEALIWEFCGWYSLKDIYTFFCLQPQLSLRRPRQQSSTKGQKGQPGQKGQAGQKGQPGQKGQAGHKGENWW